MIASTFGKPINVMAHVGEAGITADNYSLPVAEQVKILMGRTPGVINLLLKGRDGREPQNMWDKANFGKFLIWAENNPEFFDFLSFVVLLNANVNNVEVMIIMLIYNFLILLVYFLFPHFFWYFLYYVLLLLLS